MSLGKRHSGASMPRSPQDHRTSLLELKLSVEPWTAILKVIQKTVSQSPAEHLGRGDTGKSRRPMDVFTRLKPFAILVRPLPLRGFRDSNTINQKRCKQLVNIEWMHTALAEMHKTIAEGKQRRQTQPNRCTTP